MNELRDAGLVEIAHLEERRGGTSKYYRANTIVLSYALPEDGEEIVDQLAAGIEEEIAAVADRLREKNGEGIAALAGQMPPCEHYRTQKYKTYILLTILRRAFVLAYARDDEKSE